MSVVNGQASERREVVVSDLVTVVELARALGQDVDKVQAVLRDLGEETKSHDSPVSFDAAELAAGEFQACARRKRAWPSTQNSMPFGGKRARVRRVVKLVAGTSGFSGDFSRVRGVGVVDGCAGSQS